YVYVVQRVVITASLAYGVDRRYPIPSLLLYLYGRPPYLSPIFYGLLYPPVATFRSLRPLSFALGVELDVFSVSDDHRSCFQKAYRTSIFSPVQFHRLILPVFR